MIVFIEWDGIEFSITKCNICNNIILTNNIVDHLHLIHPNIKPSSLRKTVNRKIMKNNNKTSSNNSIDNRSNNTNSVTSTNSNLNSSNIDKNTSYGIWPPRF